MSHEKTSLPGFWRLVALIGLVWLVAVLVLAASEALRAKAAERVPGSPSATPQVTARTNTNPAPINCHQSAPPTSSPLLVVASSDAQHYGVDVLTFEWKIWRESGYNPNALSRAGAEGIAQFMPETAAGMGIDPWNPRQALDASARLDAGHLKQYAAQAQTLAQHYGGSVARYAYGLALAAYNAGPGATTGAWNRAYATGTRWPASGPWAWLKLLAGETQRYVPAILGCGL